MELVRYEFNELTPRWNVKPFHFEKINLFAGLSGVGKTRILNTIFNLALSINKGRLFGQSKWKIEFKIGSDLFRYDLHTAKSEENGRSVVMKEILFKNDEKIIDRNEDVFKFEGQKIPKLSRAELGLYLLKEEPAIKTIHEEFGKVFIRRMNPNYQHDAREIKELDLGGLQKDFLSSDKKKKFTLDFIRQTNHALNVQLYMLKLYHPSIFNSIVNDFKQIFPFVKHVDMRNINEIDYLNIPSPAFDALIPILVINEKGVSESIPMIRFSAGMLRALIQLLDIYMMPKGSIYLIDEIENSMGIKSLPIMMDLILERSDDIQFIFTTHHPYIFNNVNLKYWKILSRRGITVKLTEGSELLDKFGKSHQDNFTQLINSELMRVGFK